MLEIPMSQNIKDFDPIVVGPFTLRQIVCVAISCTYGIPLAFIIPIDISIRMLIVTALMFPVIACGWVKIQGKHLEKFIILIVKNGILYPKRRYPEENILYKCLPDTPKVKHIETKASKKIKGYK